MPLSPSEVHRIAHLARIEVTESEVVAAQQDLNDILALVERLQAAETADVEPMAHAQDVVLRLRDDVVTERDQHHLYQSIAPQVEADLYLVPKVIE